MNRTHKHLVTAPITAMAITLFAGSFAAANPIPYNPPPAHIYMHLEKVDIKIVGDEAKVSGIYNFDRDDAKHTKFFIYHPVFLPVYAAKGAPVEGITPKYKLDGDERWEMMTLAKPEEYAKMITSFGELPQLEGLEVQWFITSFSEMQLAPGHLITLEMEYSQKLSNGKFIYTPLLPSMKEGHDYGEITVVADHPLKLLDADKHDFVKKEGMLIVEPSDKRAVVVEVAKEAKLP